MYTYKCEKCGKETDVEKRLPDEYYCQVRIGDEKEWRICGGKLYRVYKPTYVVIKGVR